MIIEKNCVATFVFELRLQNNDGEVVEQVEKSKPMKIIVGKGALLEPFENRLLGLQKGDKFDFTLLSSETYGPYSEKAITTFDKSVFVCEGQMNDSELVIGSVIPMETDNGTPFNGKIVELTQNTVTLDFNHPLAGRDLHFSGEIRDVRLATSNEITSGQVDFKRKQ